MSKSNREKQGNVSDSEPGASARASGVAASRKRDAAEDAFEYSSADSPRHARRMNVYARWICLALALLVLVPYAQVGWAEFLLCDDNDYITTVAPVKAGLTWEGLKWAFEAPHASNWHPLTWLSHMLDCQIFGLDAGKHHLMNVVFHIATTIVLFLTVRMMTGSLWRSAAVAALFSLHPLRAESVAWVAERKDVLSGLFWMLTLLSYAWYARRPGVWRYLAVFFTLLLGLLCKSMAVTMPFLLLLLDVWPLRRLPLSFVGTGGLHGVEPCAPPPRRDWLQFLAIFDGVVIGLLVVLSLFGVPFVRWIDDYPWETLGMFAAVNVAWCLLAKWPWGRVVSEKLPLLYLAFIISWIAVIAQGGYGSITGTDDLTMKIRVANALVTYAQYLWDMVWPTSLGLFYPHPASVSQSLNDDLFMPAVVAGVILLGITIVVIRQRMARPWLLLGWLWYLGTLVPVIGIVQIGAQSRADRYTYLTMIGITMAIVWSVGELLARQPRARAAAPWVGAVLGVVLIAMTWMQVSYWKTDFTLFERSAQVIPKNYFAYNQLGAAYREKREAKKAEDNFADSLKFNPDYDFGNNNLGVSLMEKGALDEARKRFEHAVRVNAQFVPPLRNLALLLAATGHPAEAALYCERVITLQPGNASAQAQLGSIYEQIGQIATTDADRLKLFTAAEQRFKVSLELDPFDPRATRLFGIFYANRGDLNNAVKLLTKSVSELDPNDADAWNALGVVLAQQGDKAKGIACLEKALMIAPQHPQAQQNLTALRGQP